MRGEITLKHKNCEINKLLIENNLKDITSHIEENRRDLYLLIDRIDDFTDKKVIEQSQKLDILLNIYEQTKHIDRIQRV